MDRLVPQLDFHPGRNNGNDVFSVSYSFREAITKQNIPVWLFAWSCDFMDFNNVSCSLPLSPPVC